jgi:hypothetical protein
VQSASAFSLVFVPNHHVHAGVPATDERVVGDAGSRTFREGNARGMSLGRHPFADVDELFVECCSNGVEETTGGRS